MKIKMCERKKHFKSSGSKKELFLRMTSTGNNGKKTFFPAWRRRLAEPIYLSNMNFSRE
jgi:hypothetical protein